MASDDSYLLLFLRLLPSHSESWLTCMISRILLKCQCMTSEARPHAALKLPVCFLLDHLLWGKSPFMSLGEVHETRNCKASLPTASTSLPTVGASHPGSRYYHPILTFRWLQPKPTSCLLSMSRLFLWTSVLASFILSQVLIYAHCLVSHYIPMQ